MKKITRISVLAVIFTFIMCFTAFAGRWVKDGYGWWYQYNDGSYPKSKIVTIDGEKYAFDKRGYMRTNQWIDTTSGNWYYCTNSGAIARNQWIEGKYYVGDNGVMLTNTWTPDGYYVGSSGAWDSSKGRKGQSGSTSGSYSQSGSTSGSYSQSGNASSSSNQASLSKNTGYITIDGNWDNRDQAGFSRDSRVDCWIEINPQEPYIATMNFGLYMSTGTPYSLYDQTNPNGDTLSLGSADGLHWGARSTISDKWYELEYDGRDTIILTWRSTSWTSGRLVFKRRSGGRQLDYWTSGSEGGGVG